MSTKMTSSTFLTDSILPIEVTYDRLPAELGLPEQIDITSIVLEVVGVGGKKRRVELLHTFDESQIIELEDKINE